MHNDRYDCFKILLTYRSNNLNVQDFIGQVTYLITFYKPDLVLVDFNINALRNSCPLLNTVRQYGYTLLGTESMHIMGRLLSHVYMRNNAKKFWHSDT